LVVPGRWVELEVEPIEGGARILIRDVTARVRSEASPSASAEAGSFSLIDGPTEIALLDQRGVILSANSAWRASVAALGAKVADAGVGMRYVDVCMATLPDLDQASLERELGKLFGGEMPQMEGTYRIETVHGRELRHLQITPLRLGSVTYFVATHEDLTERARVLAALHETADQLLHAQEQERQRIAIELHDSMSQHLAGLLLGLTGLRRRAGADPVARALIDDLSKLTKQAAQEARVLSYLMNASLQGREGLKAPVQRFVEGFGARTGLKATVRTEGAVDALNGAVRHAVFRVVQEALTNVYRHAHATRVAVSLVSRAGRLTLRIADNGRGLPPESDGEAAPLGVGIPGMRSRIEQLGGTLTVASDGSGAVVTASLPVVRT
jgi:signal transduction histidine kinase